MTADPPPDGPVGMTVRGPDASARPVDWALVRRLHETTATALAEELKRRPALSP